MSRSSDEAVALAGGRLALSSLRERLDAGSARAGWRADPDGVLGRALEVPTGATVTYPLRLANDVTFAARAMLYPHDWRDRRGAVAVSVAVTDEHDHARTLWHQPLRAGDRGRPSGHAVRIRLLAGTKALHLAAHPARRPPEYAVQRAIWVEPALLDPQGVEAAAPRAAVGHARSLAGSEEPLISVLVPVHDPPTHMLAEAVESVLAQTFSDWELCLVDDGSRDPAVLAALDDYANHPRIQVHRHPVAKGISAATNTALAHASGRYIALLDHDDTLAPDALERVTATIAADPSLDMVYTDEDIVDRGRQVWVHLKPAWSPDTLRTNGYTCHLGVYRRALVEEIGGFRTQFDGSQDIDMILRLTERTDRVAHVPGILYHWRAHAASTAGGDAKPYAYVAARNAYAAHLERTGMPARVGYGPPGLYRVACAVDPATPVAIVLAVNDATGLAPAARSWLAQDHAAWTLTLSAPHSAHAEIMRALADAGLGAARVTLLGTTPGEDRTRSLVRAAVHAAEQGEFITLLQSAAAGVTAGWLARLLGYAAQPGIAAAGPIVLAGDGRVAHGGVALPDGLPLYLLHGRRTSMDDFFGYGTSVHNVSALSGALVTSSATFRELGGLDPALKDLVLVDYCVRAREAGHRIVTVPDARLRLSAGDDAANDLSAMWTLAGRWSARHSGDPYYNPGYRTDRGDFVRRGS